MASWRYEISLLVFSTLEEKFRISSRPCNILYVMSYFPSSCLSLPLAVLTKEQLKEEPGGKARNLACITKCKELDN